LKTEDRRARQKSGADWDCEKRDLGEIGGD
jgi:hypothetical protein